MLDLRYHENDAAVEEIPALSTFGETEPINDRMFRLISAFIADGRRCCLPESLQPSRWSMTPAVGNASPRNLTGSALPVRSASHRRSQAKRRVLFL
ncbi:hypothetical protein LNO36_14225 [Klebsiella variicola subsp. variicola]|nr:hypothetical protein [Klebsiella variicola subsp. variicola]